MRDFISETASTQNTDWKIRCIPADLHNLHVEITGSVEQKMIINALNTNVKVFMADFEDSLSSLLKMVIDGNRNLRDVVRAVSRTSMMKIRSTSLNRILPC